METMTSSWTDDRMDDLKLQVDELGRKMDHGFAEVNRRLDEGFAEVNRRMDEGFRELNQRFDALQRTVIMLAASMFAAMLGLIAIQL